MVLLLTLQCGAQVLLPKNIKTKDAVCEFAAAPGPADLGLRGWCSFPARILTRGDFDCWPYSTGLLIRFSAFLGSLHWPSEGEDLVMGGVSFIEVLILYELWAGERLALEAAVPKVSSKRTLNYCDSGYWGKLTQFIWRSCRLIGALFRALQNLPGGLSRFLPGRIGGKPSQAPAHWLGNNAVMV